MEPEEKSPHHAPFLERLRKANRIQFAPAHDNSERLDYTKGNIQQNKDELMRVWETCPVLDEQGKPIEEGENPDEREKGNQLSGESRKFFTRDDTE